MLNSITKHSTCHTCRLPLLGCSSSEYFYIYTYKCNFVFIAGCFRCSLSLLFFIIVAAVYIWYCCLCIINSKQSFIDADTHCHILNGSTRDAWLSKWLYTINMNASAVLRLVHRDLQYMYYWCVCILNTMYMVMALVWFFIKKKKIRAECK